MSKFCLLLFYMRRRGLVRFHLLQIRSRSCVFFDITFSFLSCLSCFSRHHVLLSFSLLCIVLSWRHYNGGRLTHAKPRNAAQRRIRAHLLMHKKRQNKKPNVGLEPTASRSPDIEVLRATIAPAGLICRVDVSIDIYWLHRMCVELGPSSRFHWLEIAEIKPSHVARRTPKLSIIETVASYYTLHTSAQTLL
jgi:hypothetical protein